MAAEIGMSVAKKITELLIDPIQRELGYFFYFNNNIQELESRIIELKATRSDVQGREEAEQRMRKTLGQRVELWIEDANKKIAKAENVINDKAQVQKGCFSIKWCPNIRLRYTFGKKGKKLSLVLKELLQSGDSLPNTGHALPMPPINMSDYNGDACEFRSRVKFMDEIIDMLQDEETMLIGICGMGGLGKTTFAKQLLQKVQDLHKHLFDSHVFLTVSSNPNFNTIQQHVLEMLGGSSIREIESEIVRAQYVRNAFSNKKVLVLFDDVWKKFDLNANGFPLTKSGVGNCCKIIYTSRNKDLWADQGITKKEISLHILSNEESLNLFRRKVNLQDNDIDFCWKNEIAIGIVDECKGLPLALEVAAGALIKKSKHVWEDMIFKLNSQKHHNEEIHKVLETSYNYLEDPIAKYMLLICCLFNEDQIIPIEKLYHYTMSLQCFKDMNDLRNIRNRVYTLVDELITRNLLINVEILEEGERVVKMHDVVRDVGLSIAKRDNDFSILLCGCVNELKNDIPLHSKAISILFLKSDLKIPNGIKLGGSQLELLRLDSSEIYPSNTEISWNLFEGASDLKIIDITEGTMISDFSYSFSFPYLSKLKMLSLERLNLNTSRIASFIQHLSCLEILNFQGSEIKVLPNEVTELKNLKVLNMTKCKCFISSGIFSKLTNLQELYMWGSFKDWKALNKDVSNTVGRDNNEAELVELNCLKKLWLLELMVNNIEQVPRDVTLFSSSTLLKQFKISIGNRNGWNEIKFESGERQLWLYNVEENINMFPVIGALIENDITNLYLWNNSRTWEKMCVHNFLSSLKDIVLKQCGSAITLFTPSPPSSQISQIEKTNGFGCYLRRIEIYECNQMRHLCSTSISMHLKHLQILVLEKCEMIEEIVNTCNNTEQPEKIEFNALETLELCDLGQLKYFSKEINEIHFLRLRRLKLQGLEQFIFPSKIEIPHLIELEIISMPNITTLCNIMNSSLQTLKIENCDNLKYVFSNSFIKNIPDLESLIIRECQMLKWVKRVSTSTDEQGKKLIEFPKLIFLELESLDKLVSFVINDKNLDDDEEKEDGDEEKLQNSLFYCDDEDRVLFPCLKVLLTRGLSKIYHIVGWKVGQEECPHVKEHQEPISLSLFPMLEQLELTSLNNLIHVYESNHSKLGVSLFQNMKDMWIRDCGKLRYLFTENIGRVVAMQLDFLHIANCPRMEVVMKSDAENDDDRARGGEGIISVPNTHFLPLLKSLSLINMPCLRSFGDVEYTWALPSLYWLTVSACPKLETLSPGYLDSPKLFIITYNDRDRGLKNWNGDINTELRDLFIQNPPDDLPVTQDNNIDKELARQ